MHGQPDIPNSAMESLVTLVQAIKDDKSLLRFFCDLAGKPGAERAIRIKSLVEQMSSAGENAKFVSSFRLLADARVFNAVWMAVQDN